MQSNPPALGLFPPQTYSYPSAFNAVATDKISAAVPLPVFPLKSGVEALLLPDEDDDEDELLLLLELVLFLIADEENSLEKVCIPTIPSADSLLVL